MNARSTPPRGMRVFTLLLIVAAACQESAPPDVVAWQEVELSTDAEFRDIFFLDENRGWIVGGGFDIDGGILGETTDGGIHWRFRSGIVSGTRTSLFHLNAVVFQSPSTGIIAADEGRLMRTVDGGAHWHPLLRAGRQFSDLFFVDANLGWAAGEQWVMRTEDGGQSWVRANAVGEGHDDFRANGIHFVDARRGWLVGHHGTIRRTEDGGTSWLRVEVPQMDPMPRLSAVHFADKLIGWSVGDRGTILNSRDGGRTWARQPSGTPANLRDVHFIDEHRGWTIGFDPAIGQSTVLHTTDAGATWREQATIEGEALEALTFQADGRGWSVGDRVRRLPQRLLRYTPPDSPSSSASSPRTSSPTL